MDNSRYDLYYYDVLHREYWARAFFAVKDTSILFLAYTDYGVYGYVWPNIGPGPWDEFLRNLKPDYLLSKFHDQNEDWEQIVFVRSIWPEIMKRVGVPF